jgi:hypothetical protein
MKEMTKSEMLKTNQHFRKPHRPSESLLSIPKRLIEDGVVFGQVVDLATVDSNSPKLMEVISWAASAYMQVLVVPNDAPRREGYFHDQSISLCEVDRIVPFQNRKGKSRTQTEIMRRVPLDLPSLPSTLIGNPRYIVCLPSPLSSSLLLTVSLAVGQSHLFGS